MKAFYGDIEIKNNLLKQLQMHFDADEIVKGTYWENGKGCAIGCTIHSDDHAEYETKLGIPQILARLEDKIFENLPNELAKTWPLRFIEVINVGADLSEIWPNFVIFLLTDSTQCNSEHKQCGIIAEAFENELSGIRQNWFELRENAAANAANAAYAAANAAYAAANAAYAATNAAYAATNAAYAAANAAYAANSVYAANAAYAANSAYAANAAANAANAAANAANAAVYATAAAARQNPWIKQSEKLLELLKECN